MKIYAEYRILHRFDMKPGKTKALTSFFIFGLKTQTKERESITNSCRLKPCKIFTCTSETRNF